MLVLFRPWLVTPLLALVGLVISARCAWFADERYAAASARASAGCRAYRRAPRHVDADVCREDNYRRPTIGMFKEATAALARARAASARGDRAYEIGELTWALDLADEADRRATVIDEIVAARIVADALDLINKDRLPPHVRLQLFAHVQLSSARAPLESMRVHRDWLLVREPPMRGVLGRFLAAEAVADNDVTLSEMERALVAGDLARCEAASQAQSRVLPSGVDALMCPKLARVVETGARLDSAVADAISDADLPVR